MVNKAVIRKCDMLYIYLLLCSNIDGKVTQWANFLYKCFYW